MQLDLNALMRSVPDLTITEMAKMQTLEAETKEITEFYSENIATVLNDMMKKIMEFNEARFNEGKNFGMHLTVSNQILFTEALKTSYAMFKKIIAEAEKEKKAAEETEERLNLEKSLWKDTDTEK